MRRCPAHGRHAGRREVDRNSHRRLPQLLNDRLPANGWSLTHLPRPPCSVGLIARARHGDWGQDLISASAVPRDELEERDARPRVPRRTRQPVGCCRLAPLRRPERNRRAPLGDDDVYVIVDLPGNVSAAAMGLVVSAAGGVRTSTVVLLSSGEIDEAVRQKVEYRAPGA
ncbi:GYD domain-containing protein [Streptomyces umbrinus]|uniref:GYD domain-containing protein n=1 Tax=Streptomyces umbrinus TaxID=67370 RepID=UPI003C2EB9BD